jgi:ADP-dependent NAD(P)H-hydrate dehydratase / NAD(P)H-hydrate epimerase
VRGAWRVADIRAAEAALMATLPDGTLMQRAATGLARRCAALLGDRFGRTYGTRALLLVGAGDNGGDALFAGAMLARRGVAVRALRLADRVHEGGYAALLRAGGGPAPAAPSTVDLIIDGIVGIGGRAGLREPAVGALADATGATAGDGGRPAVVAVDVPSGVDVDTGAVPAAAVRADVTVTFGTLKPAHVVGPGAVHSGLVELVDIGLGPYLTGPPAVQVPDNDDIAGWWPVLSPEDDKYRRGVIGIAAGSERYPGAAVLSVGGALAGPAGYVRYAGTAADHVRSRFPSVVCSYSVADAGRVQAWVCGSGLGTGGNAEDALRAVLAEAVPVCLDADALTLVSERGLVDEVRERVAGTVVTPHDGEFERLAGAPPGGDRVGAARRLAADLGVTVLLKGDRTVVATPDGRAFANPTGSPALATAGTGDVLGGLLGSLLAGGLAPERAAVAAAYTHGLAGRRAAQDGPPSALDVAKALRKTTSTLIGQPR